MGTVIVQSCDRCGANRNLDMNRDLRNAKLVGGWRELSSGNRERTICNKCVSDFIDLIDKSGTRQQGSHVCTDECSTELGHDYGPAKGNVR